MAFSFWKKMFGNEGDGEPCDDLKDEKPAAGGSALTDESASEAICDAVEEAEDGELADVVSDEPLVPADLHALEQFVEYVARNLVDNADAVSLSTVEKGRVSVIQIRCEKKDIGKIIGKTGKTIAAIRLLVSGAGGRMGLRVTVDVLD